MYVVVVGIMMSVVPVVIGTLLFTGKCLFLIAVYNTLAKKEKGMIDKKRMGRFVGRLVLICGMLVLLVPISEIIEIIGADWVWMPVTMIMLVAVFASGIYVNSGMGFEKKQSALGNEDEGDQKCQS